MDAENNRAEGWKYLNKQFFGDGKKEYFFYLYYFSR